MARFTLTIDCDNAAFSCGETGKFSHDIARPEIARIMRAAIEDMRDYTRGDDGKLRDTNGNRVGEWRITEEAENPWPPIKPRALFDETKPDGYRESDRDWVEANLDALVEIMTRISEGEG